MLAQSIEHIRNEEAIYQATAARVAGANKEGWQKGIEHFRNAARIQKERPKAVKPANEQAKAWFIANGIDIIQ